MTPTLSNPRQIRSLVALAALALAAGCSDSPPNAPPGNPVPLSAVVISPEADTVQVGQFAQFTAVAYDTAGNPAAGVHFSWTSGNTAVFTVNATGRVRGVAEGVAPLYVLANGKRDTATVFVYPDTGWFVQPSDANNADLNGVFFLADGMRGWAVGVGGKVVRTADAGATWQSDPVSNAIFNLNAVWFTTPTEGWIAGNGGSILRSTNAGLSWTRLTNVFASENLMDVFFATPDTGWAVGDNGAIVRTFDRGGSWQKLNPTAFTLHSVAFAGARDGWAVGQNGVILGTHDRGLSWFIVLPAITGNDLKAVWRRGEPLAWAVGALGSAPRTVTTPDSTTWELRNAGAAFQLEGVYYPTDSVGFAVGSNSGLGAALRTTDGGVTWKAQTTNAGFALNDVFFVDTQRGWAVGQNGLIIHTARGGGQ